MSKTVVIIGHGLCGRTVAKKLVQLRETNEFKIICIDSREFYECDSLMTVPLSWGGDEAYKNNSCPQWKLKVQGVERYICDCVTTVKVSGEQLTVVTEKSGNIEADAVVAATGFHVPVLKPYLGMDWGERKNEIQKYRDAIANAKSIVVAGSGACGVHLAGDVRMFADVAGGAKIHLIVSGEKVLGKNCGESDRSLLTTTIRNAPGMVLHNDRVVGDDYKIPSCVKKSVQLKSGKTIEADVYLPSFATWNANLYLSGIEGAVAKNGMIKQDYTSLQSKVTPALFAVGCGDIAIKEGIVATPKIMAQAETVATNVQKFLARKPLINHKEGLPFAKHEVLVNFGHGYHSQVMTDDCGIPGKCCVWCGFPFPCIVCPCCPCGISCMKPDLRFMKGKVKDFAFKGDLPMMKAARNNKAEAPTNLEMRRNYL